LICCPSSCGTWFLLAVLCKLFLRLPCCIRFVCNLVLLLNRMMLLSKSILRTFLTCKIAFTHVLFSYPIFGGFHLHIILWFKSRILIVRFFILPPRLQRFWIFWQLLSMYPKPLFPKLIHVFLNVLLFSRNFHFSFGHSIWNLRSIKILSLSHLKSCNSINKILVLFLQFIKLIH